jgi:hypothetical protein
MAHGGLTILFVSFVLFCLNCPVQSVVDFYLKRITRINTNFPMKNEFLQKVTKVTKV